MTIELINLTTQSRKIRLEPHTGGDELQRLYPKTPILLDSLPKEVADKRGGFTWWELLIKGQHSYIAHAWRTDRYTDLKITGIIPYGAKPCKAELDGKVPHMSYNQWVIWSVHALSGTKLVWNERVNKFPELLGKQLVHGVWVKLHTVDCDLTYHYHFNDVIGDTQRMFCGVTTTTYFGADGQPHYSEGGWWIPRSEYFSLIETFRADQKNK